MSIFGSELSNAVVLFLGFGSSPSPRQDYDGLNRKFGPERGARLASQIITLIAEMNGITVDWSANSLESAGKLIMHEMHRRHPDLSNSALRALAWKFTFDWR